MLKMMASRTGATTMQLLPLVSTKSWRAMSTGSTWWWRNGLTKLGPNTGVDSSPTVSPAQCTRPERKSEMRYPVSAANPTQSRSMAPSIVTAIRYPSQASAAKTNTMLPISKARCPRPYPGDSVVLAIPNSLQELAHPRHQAPIRLRYASAVAAGAPRRNRTNSPFSASRPYAPLRRASTTLLRSSPQIGCRKIR